MCRTIGGSQSLITRRCRRRRRHLRPQDTAPAATVITIGLFSRWNSPWGKTPSSLVPSTHSVKTRNVSSYDIGGGISHREVEEMIGIARTLQQHVEQWIRTNHSRLLWRKGSFLFPAD